MGIYEYRTTFAGRPVAPFAVTAPETTADPSTHAIRIALDWEDTDDGVTFARRFADFRHAVDTTTVSHLIIGNWGDAQEEGTFVEVVEELTLAAPDFPALRALFLGEVLGEECEISWLMLDDLSPLWPVYPNLEHLQIRGMTRLSLGRLVLPKLKRLIIETGGLPSEVVNEVCAAELPVLEHLELWLGSSGYGWEDDLEILAPIFDGTRFPTVRSLGLRNAEDTDELARRLATAPVLRTLTSLDLSLGTLTDDGVDALIPALRESSLEALDVHHHFASEAAIERLCACGIPVNAGDRQSADEYDGEAYRYNAVSE